MSVPAARRASEVACSNAMPTDDLILRKLGAEL
jgi:hypothetical protein